jgi:hypothetical protein
MPRNIGAFHKAFLEQIRTNGASMRWACHDYKLKTGDLMKDVTNAPDARARAQPAPTRSTA